MEIGNWSSAGYVSQLYPELRRLGLEPNLAELEAFGLTVLSPDLVGPSGYHERVRDTVLRVAERRSGVRPDLQSGSSHRDMGHPLGQLMRFVLWEDRLFEEVLLNPAMLGIVTWLLGPTCILSQCNAMLKGPGTNAMSLHTDEADRTMVTFPDRYMGVNATYLLTDYTKDGGALGFVPGSHRWRREPRQSEGASFMRQIVPVEAPAGSFVIWSDHLWHAAFPRKTPGLRGTLFYVFARHTMQSCEPYRDTCTQEALDRNPRRFALLMDQFGALPWREEGENYRRSSERPGFLSLFDTQPAAGSIVLRSLLPAHAAPASSQPTGARAAAVTVPEL